MNKNYPVQQPKRHYPQQRTLMPNVNPGSIQPLNSIPKTKDMSRRNVAGKVTRTIFAKDRNGNVIRISETQNFLNLIEGASGFWSSGQGNNHGH